MIKAQWMIVVLAVTLCTSAVEARGRRMMQATTQYYTTSAPQYYTVPTQTVTYPTNVVTQTSTPVVTEGIVQTSGVQTDGGIVQAGSVVMTQDNSVPAAAPAAGMAVPGSAQWKAEQSARMGSVAHIGGGFGGGSFEGNGFGATPDQAVRNACYWGQRTPIQIGVARGANGYYATVFYR